jgi:2-oxo-4-hydroxy-4-carboxy-5-ureidoimidazoline decarboxylase
MLMNNLTQLNEMSEQRALNWFLQMCTARRWCKLMTQSRPYHSIEQVTKHCAEHWQKMLKQDFMEAFEGHPMIGDIHSLREKYAATKAIAGNEQAGTADASEATLHALQQGNKDYLDKHGFIFIICASGLAAQTMLYSLQNRLSNTSEQEMIIAAQEQLKITLLRIKKALSTKSNDAKIFLNDQ